MEGGCKEYRVRLSSVVLGVRTRNNVYKQPEHQEHFCCVELMEHWHRLSRGCRVSFLEISKSCLDMGLGTVLWVALLELGFSQMASRDNFQHQPVCDSVNFLSKEQCSSRSSKSLGSDTWVNARWKEEVLRESRTVKWEQITVNTDWYLSQQWWRSVFEAY